MGVIVSTGFQIEGHGSNASIFNPWDIIVDGMPESRALENTIYNFSKEEWYSFIWDKGRVCKNFEEGLSEIVESYENTRIPEELRFYSRRSIKRNTADLKEIRIFLKELNEYVTQLNHDKVTWKFCEVHEGFYGLFVQIHQDEIAKSAYKGHDFEDLLNL
jgi:hypothetical protein